MNTAVFRYLAWTLLVLCFFVIVWGAFVRLSGSGAGCGASWPLCDGRVIPISAGEKTYIEFFHRVTSGLALICSVFLYLLGRKSFSVNHPARRASRYVLGFMITEALIGAVLVLFGLVEYNDSAARALIIGTHLINSFLLLGAVVLSARWADAGLPKLERKSGPAAWAALIGLVSLLIVGATGAIAALGNTLFPASSLIEGLRQDFSQTAHMLIRLRTLHPIAAVGTSCYVLGLACAVLFDTKETRPKVIARLLIVAVLCQITLGFLNVLLLAPAALQLAHLFTAGLTWVLLVLTAEHIACVPARAYPGRALQTYRDPIPLRKVVGE